MRGGAAQGKAGMASPGTAARGMAWPGEAGMALPGGAMLVESVMGGARLGKAGGGYPPAFAFARARRLIRAWYAFRRLPSSWTKSTLAGA